MAAVAKVESAAIVRTAEMMVREKQFITEVGQRATVKVN